jgi:hypothetical protein
MTATLEIIKKVEEYIKTYQILIISKDEDYQFVYVGSQKYDQIILLHKNNHYDLITSLPGFFESRKFCFKCLKPYNHDKNHSCIQICKFCKRKNCSQTHDSQFKCQNCNGKANNEMCSHQIISHQEIVFNKIVKCDKCGRFKTKRHVCDGRWCFF